ncbi:MULTISPECIES: SecY-interacting protein [Edwardsiella]|uniref:Protein Syd n=2 Tax=Edwardsiella anguillarum TaxID=1821960 RepID=A0A076LTM3_9GAMM|nr:MULTISPECIES: SecY-interacting protein [Edwardsiella]AKM48720.1 secretion protein [Edwardsiella sp. EA181011]GAJ66780.1 protein Syd [Edwardsiella piscicida]AIJ08929.1 Syd protein [Edwardsiella anguillarum ET080813]AKR76911.1 SecY-interacting protein [Edwardsiella sp. LADL05-105]KAB0592312.1 SecY-interacting protein [Edwardsiella anguillarum]
MEHQVSAALREFTQRYVAQWQQQHGDWPSSHALYGIPSPCVVYSRDDCVFWRPEPGRGEDLEGIGRALDIRLHPALAPFFTTQYAGDMRARWNEIEMDLVQVWSEEDLQRLQENQIGHLVTQRRLKLSPTLFLASTADELSMVTLCNLSGSVLLEQFGSPQRRVLTPTLAEFLAALQPLAQEVG